MCYIQVFICILIKNVMYIDVQSYMSYSYCISSFEKSSIR